MGKNKAYDYTISVGVDKEGALKSLIDTFTSAKKTVEANGNVIKWKVEADKDSFFASLNKFLSERPVLANSILIEPDYSSFDEKLQVLEKSAGKNAQQISKSFTNQFKKETSKSLNDIIGHLGTDKIKTKFQESANIIQDALDSSGKSLDVTKLTDYKDLENVVEAARTLRDLLKGIQGTKYSNIIDKNQIAQLSSLINIVQKGYGQAMATNSSAYKTQIGGMRKELEDAYSEIANILAGAIQNISQEGESSGEQFSENIKSGVKKGINGTGTIIANEINEGVTEGKKSIEDLKKELEDLKKEQTSLGKGSGDNDKQQRFLDARVALEDELESSDVSMKSFTSKDEYVESVKDYLKTLSETSDEYKEIIEEYQMYSKMFAEDGAYLPGVNTMSSYEKELEKIQNRQVEVLKQIEQISQAQKNEEVNAGNKGATDNNNNNNNNNGLTINNNNALMEELGSIF